MTPTGAFTEWPFPFVDLLDIVRGADGRLWISEFGTGAIAAIDVSGQIQDYTASSVQDRSAGTSILAVGPDSRIWYSEAFAGRVGRLATDGEFDEILLPNTTDNPGWICRGPGATMWLAIYGSAGDRIGRLAPSGEIREFVAPDELAAVVLGPDGNIWLTAQGLVGRLTPDGVMTTFPIGNSRPYEIVAGPDGAMWFSDRGNNALGRITMSGQVSEFAIPTALSLPTGVTVGPDHAIWFVESEANKIGRFAIPESLFREGGAVPVVGPLGLFILAVTVAAAAVHLVSRRLIA
jgi:virginiamycin B lyase